MTVQRHRSEVSSYSEVTWVDGPGRWVHVAGQAALGEDGKVIDGDVGEQTRMIFDQIEGFLGRAGADLSHVVKITVFLTSFDEYAGFSEARAERFGDELPASSTVQVADLLFGAEVEIEAVAFVASS